MRHSLPSSSCGRLQSETLAPQRHPLCGPLAAATAAGGGGTRLTKVAGEFDTPRRAFFAWGRAALRAARWHVDSSEVAHDGERDGEGSAAMRWRGQLKSQVLPRWF